jgi:glycosyltransferase involved in cell wall biosynthesis
MKKIGIVSMMVAPGDAVGNDVMGMYRVLVGRGHDVRVFAGTWPTTLTDPPMHPMREAVAFLADPASVLIYHFAVGWDEGLEVYRKARGLRVVRDHNVTPPEFFRGLDDDHVRRCEEGQRQRQWLACSGADLYLADSAYNLRDLVGLGADPARGRVVAPFHHVDRLLALEGDPGLLGDCRDGCTNIVMVGRVVPNKGHLDLLEAFAAYHHGHDRASRLLVIGKLDRRLAAYTARLDERARQLGVERAVLFLGGVTEEELKTFYLCADVFLLTSQHEGFCVPLVESMALGVPIVAVGAAAVGETVGDAGLVWDKADPELLAESVRVLTRDDAVRGTLTERGWRRYRGLFTNACLEEKLVWALQEVA